MAIDPKPRQTNDPYFEVIYQYVQQYTSHVTVVISLYNYQQYIKECLESVKKQTLKTFDLLVVDDCSQDNSTRIVESWMRENRSRFNRCSLLRHKQNMGLAQTRNTAFDQACTPFVFVLDADNALYPRCLERHLAVLSDCDASFSYSYLEVFGAVKGLQNTILWDKKILQFGNMVDAMVMLRKSAWEQAGGYSIMEVMGWEDYDLWFKIARNGGWGILIPEILARYRVHTKSMLRTITNSKTDRLREILLQSYPEYFTDPYVRLDILSKTNRYDEAIQVCIKILQEKPQDHKLWKHLLWLYLKANRINNYKDAAVKMLFYCPEIIDELIDDPKIDLSIVKEIVIRATYEKPDEPIFYQAMAKLFLLEGHIQECIQNAKIARELSEQRKTSIRTKLQENCIQQAQMLVNQWIKEEPQNPGALFFKAICEVRQQKLFSAIRIFEQIILAGHKDPLVLENYIDTALRANKKGLALKLLEEFILLEPTEEWQQAISRLAQNWPDLHIFRYVEKHFNTECKTDKDPANILELLLEADDLVEAFQQYSDCFDQKLIDHIKHKAAEAANQSDQHLASIFYELADSIEQFLNQYPPSKA
jgi:glycosyltransferase involved in cell wall biosynthesis